MMTINFEKLADECRFQARYDRQRGRVTAPSRLHLAASIYSLCDVIQRLADDDEQPSDVFGGLLEGFLGDAQEVFGKG